MPPSDEKPAFSLKDALFNEQKIALMAGWLKQASPKIDADGFQRRVLSRLTDLELKARIAWIADCLEDVLPASFPKAADTIVAALPPPLDPTLSDDDFGDFIFAPFGEYVARHGVPEFKTAMATLRELTMRFSMEDAVRTFLKARPDAALDILGNWAQDDNYHVRRLVSEGTRPRLPWSSRLSLPQERVLDLLDALHSDRTRFVTRSVSNHLNDIAKDNPPLVVDTLRRWHKANKQDAKELDWMTRHSLRTLIKAGDAKALALVGYAPDPPVRTELSIQTPKVVTGETLQFSLAITADKPAKLLVDYAIGFRKANGSLAPKVFKLKTLDLEAGQTATIDKKHRLLANASTYTLYPGRHDVRIQINGGAGPEASFELL